MERTNMSANKNSQSGTNAQPTAPVDLCIPNTPAGFLRFLAHDCEAGSQVVFTLPGNHTSWFAVTDPDAAGRYVTDQALTKNVFAACAVHDLALDPKAKSRTTKTAVAVACVWADVDVASPYRKGRQRYFQTKEEALAWLRNLPLPPTLIVDSGYGLQAYWALRELWRFTDDADRQQAASLLRRWNLFLIADAKTRGVDLDNACDLARVLRIPGTCNHKSNLPLLVKVVEYHPEIAYNHSDFDPYLPEAMQPPPVSTSPAAPLPADLPPVCVADLDIDPKYKRLIRKGRAAAPVKYHSRSEAVFAIESALIQVEYDDATIASVLLDKKNGISEMPLEKGRAWVAADITRARVKIAAETQDTDQQPADTGGSQGNGKGDQQPPAAGQPTDPTSSLPEFGKKDLRHRLTTAILDTGACFARDQGGKLYVCRPRKGVYTPDGQAYVIDETKRILQEWQQAHRWTAHYAEESVRYLRAGAPYLWECPPGDQINLTNGVLNLTTRALTPPSPEWLSPVQLPVKYDPDATCPQIEQYVRAAFPEDSQALAYEIAGALLTPNIALQLKAVLLLGNGGNGKSRFLHLLTAFIGAANCEAMSLHTIESNRFTTAGLFGKLANICSDLPSRSLADTEMFKRITDGLPIRGEHKYAEGFTFRPFCKLVFSANRPPQSGDDSQGFFDRWLVLYFPRTFRDQPGEVDADTLDQQLTTPEELSGLLNRAVAAWTTLRTQGRYSTTKSTQKGGATFRETTDPLAVWLDQETVRHPDAFVVKTALLRAYNSYRFKQKLPGISEEDMGKSIKLFLPTVMEGRPSVAGKREYVWRGLGLRENPPTGEAAK